MIKRLVVELTENVCLCPDGTRFALDIQAKGNKDFELQVACTKCGAYQATPLNVLSALITVDVKTENRPKINIPKGKPKLTLIQGGASRNTSEANINEKREDLKQP